LHAPAESESYTSLGTAQLHPAAARQLKAPLDARFPTIQSGDAIVLHSHE
jgi:hypothetical protein